MVFERNINLLKREQNEMVVCIWYFSEENKRWNKSAEQMTFLGARIMKK